MSNSIYRDRTQEFFKLRQAAKKLAEWQNGQVASAHDVAAQRAKNDDAANNSGPPPSWVRAVESFVDIERGVTSKLELLVTAQREVFAPKFGMSEEEAQEQENSVVTYNGETQRLLKEAERMAKNITVRESATPGEQLAAENVKKHLATRLANMLTAFRKAQSGYTNQLKQREERKQRFKKIPANDASTHERLEKEEKVTGYLSMGYSEAEISELIFMEQQKLQQNAAITELMHSVQEVHEMFKDLQNMIVEQGTMLDRIDMNVRRTQASMEKGNAELKKAREEQKKCIIM